MAEGACASPFVILSGAKDILSAAGAAWGGKDPSAALPPQDDRERRHWFLRMTEGRALWARGDERGRRFWMAEGLALPRLSSWAE